MSDAQEPKQPHDSVSRRTMLKRIGAVGAIAWVTPVISSLNTPAYTATSFVTCVHCETNTDLCGQGGPLGTCFCTPRADGGDCFCGEEIFCSSTHDCGTTSDCDDLGPTWICADVCGCGGGSVCIPTCGTDFAAPHGAAARGATTAGRTV